MRGRARHGFRLCSMLMRCRLRHGRGEMPSGMMLRLCLRLGLCLCASGCFGGRQGLVRGFVNGMMLDACYGRMLRTGVVLGLGTVQVEIVVVIGCAA